VVLAGACAPSLGFYMEDPKTHSVSLTASASQHLPVILGVCVCVCEGLAEPDIPSLALLRSSFGPLCSHPVHLRTSFLTEHFGVCIWQR
jgi:hypothetical protein